MPTDYSALVNGIAFSRLRALESTAASTKTSTLTDLILAGHTVSQATTANQPLAAANDSAVNNQKGIIFADTQYLVSNRTTAQWKFLSDGSPWEMFLVVTPTTTSGTGNFNNYVNTDSVANSTGFNCFNDPSGNIYCVTRTATGDCGYPLVGPTVSGVPVVVNFQSSTALSPDWQLRVTGQTQATGDYTTTPSTSNPTTSLTIGRTDHGIFSFYELIICNFVCTAAQRTTINQYIASQYHIANGYVPSDVAASFDASTAAATVGVTGVTVTSAVAAQFDETTGAASVNVATLGTTVAAQFDETTGSATANVSSVGTAAATFDASTGAATVGVAAPSVSMTVGATFDLVTAHTDAPAAKPSPALAVPLALDLARTKGAPRAVGVFAETTTIALVTAIPPAIPIVTAASFDSTLGSAVATWVAPNGGVSAGATFDASTASASLIALGPTTVTSTAAAGFNASTGGAAITVGSVIAPVGGPGGYTNIIVNDVFGSSMGGTFTSTSQFNPGTGYGSSSQGWDTFARSYGDTSPTASVAMGTDHLEIYPTNTSKPSWLVSHFQALPTGSVSYYYEVVAAVGRGGGGAFDGNTAWPAIWLYVGSDPAQNDQQSEIDIMENYCDQAFGGSTTGGLYTNYFTTTIHGLPGHSTTEGPKTTITGGDITVNYNTYGVELTLSGGQVYWNVYFNGGLAQSASSGISWASSAPALFLGWNQGSSPYSPAIFKLQRVRVWSK